MTLYIKKTTYSSEDNSIKYAFLIPEKENLIEGIYFRLQSRSDFPDDIYHMCISSQAGCAMGCTFCATGYGGFFSQISSEEMLNQVDLIYKDVIENSKECSTTKFSVGLMGMGEPFMNYSNVEEFCYSAPKKFNNLYAICISTVGIVPKIKEAAKIAKDIGILRLFVSIHSPYDKERSYIMPITNNFPIQSVLEASRVYHQETQSKIILSYLLLGSINKSEKHAEDFAKLIANDNFFIVQILLYNETPEIPFSRPSNESAAKFRDILNSHGIETIIQISKGQDIDGGCGQFIKKINRKTLERRKRINHL